MRCFFQLMSRGSCTSNLGTTCQGSKNKKHKTLERRPKEKGVPGPPCCQGPVRVVGKLRCGFWHNQHPWSSAEHLATSKDLCQTCRAASAKIQPLKHAVLHNICQHQRPDSRQTTFPAARPSPDSRQGWQEQLPTAAVRESSVVWLSPSTALHPRSCSPLSPLSPRAFSSTGFPL